MVAALVAVGRPGSGCDDTLTRALVFGENDRGAMKKNMGMEVPDRTFLVFDQDDTLRFSQRADLRESS
ncbi:hypothetical protein [Streptomyces lonarensis]|uniref:Uncharacterized protein n=1 Tax=Streptomyces lonarensis TaxID=700599 RepID=A0A7X6CXM9_9ACTN|nr:hypothetical protein [Streptomyces lonarensis]NJQ04313.1 hypothetical protein [Streptomyces lonarensis]